MNKGCFIGVGVGPGDPELLTLKAVREILAADVIAYLSNTQGQSQAKQIACLAIKQLTAEVPELAVVMPMSNDRQAANEAYDRAAEEITGYLSRGKTVVFLCEGDPLFFGSFAYLLERLQIDFNCRVVPGISSVNASAAAFTHPLIEQQESLAIVSGRHSDARIEQALREHDSVVIMKAGRSRRRLLSLLTKTGRKHEARYGEYIGRDNQWLCSSVEELTDEAGPYFSLFIITREREEL
ncbi:precorrin-2/cobalt-factor-2 C20-methyltransferase [Sinobacterium caligoides]|uniref:Precorrin-2/cobalt-factor-2 C20-methyltransferase n=1 Tax=Sinobacterium caligoides TaxID=933926 RepID=A0A3N2DZM9_9GAMM|nr:precorrin-2 C(20)-methyltransferase [Sinobacterium caligoides]ROS04889.1 precorrin-2/cobalt-factor-2 C20-methyltransferase [Sinobacterium caligoides]